MCALPAVLMTLTGFVCCIETKSGENKYLTMNNIDWGPFWRVLLMVDSRFFGVDGSEYLCAEGIDIFPPFSEFLIKQPFFV